MNDKKIADGLSFLLADKRITVIYGVLKRLHINRWHDNYDDLFQEGCLAFAKAFATYPGDVHEDRFMAYAYQRVYWRLLDILRRNLRLTNPLIQAEDDQSCASEWLIDSAATKAGDHVINTAFFTSLAQTCSLKQRRYLHATLNWQLSDREIAEYYAVSPSAVYQWKRGLIAKARRLNYNNDEFEVRK